MVFLRGFHNVQVYLLRGMTALIHHQVRIPHQLHHVLEELVPVVVHLLAVDLLAGLLVVVNQIPYH